MLKARLHVFHLFAAALLAVQSLASAFAVQSAMAGPRHLLCLPTGQASPAALAAARALQALIDGDATQEDAAQRHCPLCSLPTAIAVAAPASPQSPNDFSLPCVIGDDPVRLDVSLAGPPVGTRAPPTLS